MAGDPTSLDVYGWDAVKKALNLRVVPSSIKHVPSRRNRVWIVETDVRPVVVKRFFSGRCGHEFEMLLQARSARVDVPYPLWKEGEYLVSEYVDGESCEMLVNHMFSTKAVDGIGEWLASYHSSLSDDRTTATRGDSVLSNFILHEGRVWGLDLENSAPGNPLDDLGQMAASILGSEPYFTPIKFDLCARMLRSYERASRMEVLEKVRPYVSRHLRLDAAQKPLFRRTLVSAAKSIEKGWPRLA